MAKKKIRRSETAYRRKLLLVWIVSLFFLALLVLLDVIIVYNQMHPVNRALSEPVDYSKIHFEGLAVGKEASPEILEHPIVDSNYNYSWNNISIAVDNDNIITRLGFYTTEPSINDLASEGANIDNTLIDYRDYPLLTISDFVTYFGYTKVTNFDHYKYLTYQDDRYVVDITLYNRKIYNIELYKK